MPAPLRVQLSEEADEALRQLSLSDGPAAIVKQRAQALRLNAAGWNVPAIAQHLQLHEHTVRHALKRWQAEGLAGLWDAPALGDRAAGKREIGQQWRRGCKSRAAIRVVSSVKNYNRNATLR